VFDDGVVDVLEGAGLFREPKDRSAAQGEGLARFVEDHLNAADEGHEAKAADASPDDGEEEADEFAIKDHCKADADEDEDENAQQDRHDPWHIGKDQLVGGVAGDLHGRDLRGSGSVFEGARAALALGWLAVLDGLDVQRSTRHR